MSNLIDVNLKPEVKDSVLQAILSAKTAMPFLIKLADDERKSLQTIDDGRKPFVDKSLDLAKRNAQLDPGAGMIDQASNDIDLYSFLSTVENELRQLLEMVRDSKQLAGSEAYEVARFVYMKAKMNVKMSMPGSQSVVDELSKLFKQNGSSPKDESGK